MRRNAIDVDGPDKSCSEATFTVSLSARAGARVTADPIAVAAPIAADFRMVLREMFISRTPLG
jgi:hypothetical protein